MQTRHVKELMEADLKLIGPDATLTEAAKKMKECGFGFLPVGDHDSPEGIITDRDIIIRAIAGGKNPAKEKVRDCMTHETHACRENDTLQDATEAMQSHNVSRLLVKDEEDKVCGVLTFGRITRAGNLQGNHTEDSAKTHAGSNGHSGIFTHGMQRTYHWLDVINRELDDAGTQSACHTLKTVLHALRDRLDIDQSAAFATQLPMPVRGIYYEGWNPQDPSLRRSRKKFLADIEQGLKDKSIEPMEACHAVFRVLDQYVSPDALQQMKQSLPKAIRRLWTHPDAQDQSKPIYNPKEKTMANYNEQNHRRSRNRNIENGRHASHGRDSYDRQNYSDMRHGDHDRAYTGGYEDYDMDGPSYGRNHENRDYYNRESEGHTRGHGRYASDRSYQGGYYGRDEDENYGTQNRGNMGRDYQNQDGGSRYDRDWDDEARYGSNRDFGRGQNHDDRDNDRYGRERDENRGRYAGRSGRDEDRSIGGHTHSYGRSHEDGSRRSGRY